MNILRCPFCFLQGKNERLCEILDDGSVRVIRFDTSYHQYDFEQKKQYTTIKGDNFSIYCGKCGNEVYYKRTRRIDNIPVTYNAVEMMGTIII